MVVEGKNGDTIGGARVRRGEDRSNRL